MKGGNPSCQADGDAGRCGTPWEGRGAPVPAARVPVTLSTSSKSTLSGSSANQCMFSWKETKAYPLHKVLPHALIPELQSKILWRGCGSPLSRSEFQALLHILSLRKSIRRVLGALPNNLCRSLSHPSICLSFSLRQYLLPELLCAVPISVAAIVLLCSVRTAPLIAHRNRKAQFMTEKELRLQCRSQGYLHLASETLGVCPRC